MTVQTLLAYLVGVASTVIGSTVTGAITFILARQQQRSNADQAARERAFQIMTARRNLLRSAFAQLALPLVKMGLLLTPPPAESDLAAWSRTPVHEDLVAAQRDFEAALSAWQSTASVEIWDLELDGLLVATLRHLEELARYADSLPETLDAVRETFNALTNDIMRLHSRFRHVLPNWM